MTAKPNRWRRWRRRLTVATAAAVVLMAIATVVLRVYFNGPRLAETVKSALEGEIRGRVEVGSIQWPLSSLHTVVTGGWLPIEVRELKVYDEHGEMVIDAPIATLAIDVHPAIFRKTYRIRDVKILHGGYALIKQVKQPYPAHQYDTHVVSLLSAFYPKKAPTFSAGIVAAKAPLVDVRDYHGEHLTFEFRFPTFTAVAEEVSVRGFYTFDGNDPLAPKVYYSLTPTAERASVAHESIVLALTDVNVTNLSQIPLRWPEETMPRDVHYQATAKGPNGMTLEIDGGMLDHWIDIFGGEHRTTVRVTKAGPLAEALTEAMATGDDLTVKLDIDGPVLAPKLAADVTHLDLRLPLGEERPPLELRVNRALAEWDLATHAGSLHDTVATGAGGEVHLAANFRLSPLSFDLRVDIPQAIEVGPYLPEHITRLAGGQLSGKLYAFGNQQIQRLDELNLRLGDAYVTGQAYRTAEGLIEADTVDVSLRETRIRGLHGQIDTKNKTMDLRFQVASGDAQTWLRYAGAPPLMKGVSGTIHVNGPMQAPRADANLVLTGLPLVDRLETRLSYADAVLDINQAQASTMGGHVRGSGKVVLGERALLRDVKAQASDISLDKLPLIGRLLTGKVDVQLDAAGTAKRPEISASAKVSNWSIAGERYKDTSIAVKSNEDGSRQLEGTIERELGGILHVDAQTSLEGALSGVLSLRKLPIDSILSFDESAPLLGGTLSSEMQLGGTLAEPSFDGEVTLLRSWFQEAFLGTAELEIDPAGDGKVHVSGQLFQGKVAVDGVMATSAPFSSELQIVLRRIELDRFAPALTELYGIRGWVSGTLTYRGNLSGPSNLSIVCDLTEAEVVVDNEDVNGRPSPIRLRNRTPLKLTFDGKNLRFLETAIIRGPTGDFSVSGSGSRDLLDFHFDGSVAVQFLEPYFKQQFESMSGTLTIGATATGTLFAPRIVGVLEIDDVKLKPAGQDAIVAIPAGKIDFSNDQLSLTGLSMVVVDEFSDERAELTVAGGVRLQDFEPAMWAVRIDGKLAGKMLLVLAPQVFSAASGSAMVSVALLGSGKTPDIDGTIEFDRNHPLSIAPRAARREILLNGGVIRFTDQLVEVEDLRGVIDDEGLLSNVSGEISLEDWQPVDVDLSISARDLLFRVPNELELSVHLHNVHVVGGIDGGLEIGGQVEVVDGRYIRKFNPVIDALRPVRSAESSTPFYEDIPLLKDARLGLSLIARSFFVANNVANIELNGDLKITGTPARPHFEGVIHVEEGSFKFQGIRARFERTTGSVQFLPFKKFPDDTPDLTLDSESNYRDIDGQNHLVQLSLRGPLSNLDWDLRTSAGFNKAQTLGLILSGRTPDDVRASAGDVPVGRSPGDFEGARSTAPSDNSLQALDQLAKDIAGDWFSLIIEDRLRSVTKLDVARLQVGTASIGFQGQKDVTRSWRLVFDVERSLRGWNWGARSEYRLNDSVSVDGEALQQFFDDDADEDRSQARAKFTWRYLIP